MKKPVVVSVVVLGLLAPQSCVAAVAAVVRGAIDAALTATGLASSDYLRSRRIAVHKTDLIHLLDAATMDEFRGWINDRTDCGKFEVADLLHVRDSLNSMNLLHVAAAAIKDSGRKVAWLLDFGGFQTVINAKTNDALKSTALHIAAVNTHEDAIRELLMYNANVMEKNVSDRTPCEAMLACARYGRAAFDRMARCETLLASREIGGAGPGRRIYVKRALTSGAAGYCAVAGGAPGADAPPLASDTIVDLGSDDRGTRGKKRAASEVPAGAPALSKPRTGDI